MYRTFTPHQFFQPFQFSFPSKRIELWQDKKMTANENLKTEIIAEIIKIDNAEKIRISFNNPATLRFIDDRIIFDKVFTLGDRIILTTIPEPSSKDVIGMVALRSTSGITRQGKVFNANEPFCCSLFLEGENISLITFSFNTPEKLLEFYQ